MNQNQPQHSSDRLDPLPPLSPSALDALLISTKKLLDSCYETIALDARRRTGKRPERIRHLSLVPSGNPS